MIRYLFSTLLVFMWVSAHAQLAPNAETCRLHPQGFDSEKPEDIRAFEKNLENEMSALYQKEYPKIQAQLKKILKAERIVNQYESDFFDKYKQARPAGHPSKDRISRSMKAMRFKKAMTALIRSEELTQKDLDQFNQDFDTYEDLKLSDLISYREEFGILKSELDRFNRELDNLKSPNFLYLPRFDLNIRNDFIYGDFQWEAFFRPPAENILTMPLVEAGFKIDQNTVVYACINMDAFDTSKNEIYIYFLRTTKFWAADWTEYIKSPTLAIKNLITYNEPPKAKVNPITLTFDPVTGVLGPIDFLFNNIFFLKPFVFVNSFLQKMDFIGEAASPVMEFVMSNVGIGIKGIHIYENKYKVRFGMSTFFHMVSFNLIEKNTKSDLSAFMNVLAQPSYDPYVFAEEMRIREERKEKAEE